MTTTAERVHDTMLRGPWPPGSEETRCGVGGGRLGADQELSGHGRGHLLAVRCGDGQSARESRPRYQGKTIIFVSEALMHCGVPRHPSF